jgi:spermidine synthase
VPARFEELDWQQTPIGEISLRRRVEPTLGVDVYEVKLGDEFLMSSLFTVAEEELARLGLAQAREDNIDVLVGGLGLGYTAAAALADPRVSELVVVDAVAPVIDWHRRELLPDTAGLASDPRVQLVEGDFFQLIAQHGPITAPTPTKFDAILLDIDHSPAHVLHPSHAGFYSTEGLASLLQHLTPDGVFALWSDDPPDDDFSGRLGEVFAAVESHVVEFPNPLIRGTSANTVYVARR